MTTHEVCSYPGDRDAAFVDYLYGEGDPADRTTFERHLAECRVCREEVAACRDVRRALTAWAPPEPARALESIGAPVPPPRTAWDRGEGAAAASARKATRGAFAVLPSRAGLASLPSLPSLPSWARVAAAVLCVGVGLGAANLRVSYANGGFSVRTGWMAEPAPVAVEADAAWRTELAALAEELRGEVRSVRATNASAVPAPVAPDTRGDEALLKEIRALVARSEQRQQRELALRLGDLVNDIQAQRRADLGRIERTIGVVQSNTGMEVLRQREVIRDLVRVSAQRP